MPKSKGQKASRVLRNFDQKPRLSYGPSFGPLIVRDCEHIRMLYTDFRQYTCAANVAERVFRLNSIFDPDFTLGGGLANGYTAWSNLFQNYRILACKWTVQMTGSGNGSNGMLVCVANTASASLATSATAVTECSGLRKFSKWVQQGAGGPVVQLSQMVSMAELFGVPDAAVLGDNNYQAPFGSNPAFQGFLHVMVNDQANATGVLDIVTRLEFFVRLENPVSSTLETLTPARAALPPPQVTREPITQASVGDAGREGRLPEWGERPLPLAASALGQRGSPGCTTCGHQHA